MLQFTKTNSGYQLQGNLVYDSVTELIHQDLTNTNAKTIKIDCSKLSHIDSAGIALFIHWQRHSEQNKKKLQLNNLPPQAISLITANKLADFFYMT